MYRLGIDLGGTNIVAGLVDEEYKIVAKVSCKTNVPRPERKLDLRQHGRGRSEGL